MLVMWIVKIEMMNRLQRSSMYFKQIFSNSLHIVSLCYVFLNFALLIQLHSSRYDMPQLLPNASVAEKKKYLSKMRQKNYRERIKASKLGPQ